MKLDKMDLPALGFNFKVTSTYSGLLGIASNLLFGPDEGYFQTVSGIQASMEPQTVVSGGINNRQYKLPTTTTYSDLVLKRGIVKKSSSMGKWCRTFLINDISYYDVERKTINVMLMDADQDNVLMTWSFFDCYPKSIEIGEFNAEASELAVETLTLCYSHFNRDIAGEIYNPLNYLK